MSTYNPTYFLRPEQLAGLYMITSQTNEVSYSNLTKYSFYLSKRFNQEQKDSTIVPLISNVYFREAARDKGDVFDFQEDRITTQKYVNDQIINKEIIAWMSFSLVHPCLKYSQEYFDLQKSKKCAIDEKTL